MENDIEPVVKLNREPDCCASLGELKPSTDLTIFYKLPLVLDDNPPEPYPEQSTDYMSTIRSKENIEYVEMPFELNDESADDQRPGRQRASPWPEIVDKLTTANITTIKELIAVIKSYNQRFEKRNFNILNHYFKHELSEDEEIHFFTKTLPKMIKLAIKLPKLITQPIPILKRKTNHTLFFSQQQLASILANGFFCTYRERRRTPNSIMLDINFIKLFSDPTYGRKTEKLACLLNYFRRVVHKKPKGIVSFERRYMLPKEIPNWKKLNVKLSKMIVKSSEEFDKKGKGMLQINSTHKLVSADYMNYRTSLDSYRFASCPEILTIGLFTEALVNNEALVITGIEKFNIPPKFNQDYDVSEHNYKDKRPFDVWGRRYTKVISIDAKYFPAEKIDKQYQLSFINRDLNKVYCGIMDRKGSPAINRCAIYTNNWGCGCNRGRPQLKSLIMLIAASAAQRDVLYCNTNKYQTLTGLTTLIDKLHSKEINVSQLYDYLGQFDDYVKTLEPGETIEPLFDFLDKKLDQI